MKHVCKTCEELGRVPPTLKEFSRIVGIFEDFVLFLDETENICGQTAILAALVLFLNHAESANKRPNTPAFADFVKEARKVLSELYAFNHSSLN